FQSRSLGQLGHLSERSQTIVHVARCEGLRVERRAERADIATESRGPIARDLDRGAADDYAVDEPRRGGGLLRRRDAEAGEEGDLGRGARSWGELRQLGRAR